MAADPALTPDPAPVARFRTDLEVLTGGPPSAERRLGLAVSGGGDSLALLLLAAAAYPGAIVAATVDHGLRAEAATEAATVGAVCARLGVPHSTLTAPKGFAFDGNLQDRARALRYALLAAWAADRSVAWVATGHQRDDVAETFLMRARRGAGVGGLAAMATFRPLSEEGPVLPRRRESSELGAGPPVAGFPPSQERGKSDPAYQVALVRPLLGWARETFAVIVARAGLESASDPSNVDPRFDRSRVRALIAASPDLPAARLALAARNLRDAEEALAWAADREWAVRHAIATDGAVLLDAAGLPYEIRRRLVRRAIDQVAAAPGVRYGAALDRLVRLLEAGRPATLAGIVARPGSRWRFMLAPPRRAT